MPQTPSPGPTTILIYIMRFENNKKAKKTFTVDAAMEPHDCMPWRKVGFKS